MTDFDYENFQKKSIARSAARRKVGAKSKRCSLPSDALTPSQIKKQHGKVVSFKMREPMSWVQFKELPKDLKEEYLRGLIQTFGCTGADVSKMLGVSPSYFNRWIHAEELNVHFRKGAKMNSSERTAWRVFLTGSVLESEPESAEPEDQQIVEVSSCRDTKDPLFVPNSVEPEAEEQPKTGLPGFPTLRSFNLTFDGELTVDEISNSIRMIAGSRPFRGRINISIYTGQHTNEELSF